MLSLFGLDGCGVVGVFERVVVVEPVDRFGGGDLEVGGAFPPAVGFDELGLVEPDD